MPNLQGISVFLYVFFCAFNAMGGVLLDSVSESNSIDIVSSVRIKYKLEKEPSDLRRLQYAEFLAGLDLRFMTDETRIERLGVIVGICMELCQNPEAKLTSKQRKRTAVLGIITSTNIDKERFFSEYLEKVDPENGLSAVCQLSFDLRSKSWENAPRSIHKFLEAKYIGYYEDEGMRLRYNIFSDYVDVNQKSLEEYRGIFYVRTLSYAKVTEHVYLFKKCERLRPYYISEYEEDWMVQLDMLYLLRAKHGDLLFSWISPLVKLQINLLRYQESWCRAKYGNSTDSPNTTFCEATLKYFSILNEQKKALEDMGKSMQQVNDKLHERKRDDRLYKQVKKALDENKQKFSAEEIELIKSLKGDPITIAKDDKKIIELEKLLLQGNEWDVYNSLGKYGLNGLHDGLAEKVFEPAMKEEQHLWEELLQ